MALKAFVAHALICAIALAVMFAPAIHAQDRPAAPAFEVAAIKPHNPNEPGGGYSFQHGRLNISNTWLRILVMNAYEVKDFQISGGPSWIDSERFDVVAKAPDTADPRDLNPMLRALLEDRFKLAVHRESRESTVYTLVIAKGGIKLHRSSPDAQFSNRAGPEGMSATKMPIRLIVSQFSSAVHRIVIDKTGLEGDFDYDFRWSDKDPDSQSIFTAIEEQLGLKLESAKAPVEFLIIDHAEKPSEN